jgi:type IV pilus assembly protein PilN
MRLDINLASQPYEDARQFWTVWGTAVGVVGLLTLVLLVLDVTGWVRASSDRHQIARQEVLIAEREQIRANAQTFLNQPQNRSTRDKAQFLNQLIERKAFSWTRVLENLEKVMPPRVHLVAISPQLDEDNQLVLKMIVGGDSRDRQIELVRRMEESRRFAQTYVAREQPVQTQIGDTEQAEIWAIYIPETLAEERAAGEKKTDAQTGETKAEGKSAGTTDVKADIKPKTSPNTNPNPRAAAGREH